VIRGSRKKLPANRFLPSPGPLRAWICTPLDSTRYESSRELMHATRRVMLEHLDEPDLAAPAPAPERGGVAAGAASGGSMGEP
jgi:hypothetical protein